MNGVTFSARVMTKVMPSPDPLELRPQQDVERSPEWDEEAHSPGSKAVMADPVIVAPVEEVVGMTFGRARLAGIVFEEGERSKGAQNRIGEAQWAEMEVLVAERDRAVRKKWCSPIQARPVVLAQVSFQPHAMKGLVGLAETVKTPWLNKNGRERGLRW